MPLFSKPADFRRVGITLLLTACMCYPVVLRATETDLSIHAAVEGNAPVPSDASPTVAADKSPGSGEIPAKSVASDSEPQKSIADIPAEPQVHADETEGSEIEEAASEADEASSEIASSDDLEMPTVDTTAEQDNKEAAEINIAQDPARELSVAPGQDPLLPEEAPDWVAAPPHLDGDTHTLVVSSMATVKRARVDAELDMPLCKTVTDYVTNDLFDGRQDVDLRPYITADYIRRNLIDQPEGYVAEIATSNGPMYQKWVKVNVTPEQQKQLKAWYAEAVQSKRLPPIGFGLAGLLGIVGLSHLVLRRKHAPATRLVDVDPEVQPVAGSTGTVVGTLAILGIMGFGVIVLGLFVTTTRIQQTHVEIEKVQAQKLRDAAMAEVAKARAEAEGLIPGQQLEGNFADPADIFGTPDDRIAPAPPMPPKTPEKAGQTGTQLPNADMTTTINRNGNQQIIIRTRSR